MGLYAYQNTPGYTCDFTWAVVALAVLAVVAVAVSLPYHVFHLAGQNRYRLDGTVSRKRAWKEVKHLVDFLGELLLVPLLVVTVLGGALVLVHHYVIPIPLLADLAEMFSPVPSVMEERTETGRLGDVGVLYGEWSERQGFSAGRAYVWRKLLKHNALALAFGAAVFGLFCYWFVTRYYIAVVLAYQEGILRRRKRYHKRDRAKAPRSTGPSRRRRARVPSNKLLS